MKKVMGVLVLVGAFTFFVGASLQAKPEFATKEKVGCKVCHTTAPALTPCGEKYKTDKKLDPAICK